MNSIQGLYTNAKKGDIAERVVLSGDPWRVERIKDMLISPRHIAFSREFNTYTGSYSGVQITVSSTGIGAPSSAIVMEELHEAGMQIAVRLGTVMGLSDNLLGKFLVPVGVMRRESTSEAYAPEGYPAVPDIKLLHSMNEAAHLNGVEPINAITCSMDRFYGSMCESEYSRMIGYNISKGFEDLKHLGIAGIDMESSLILTLGRLLGVRSCIVTLTTVSANLSSSLPIEDRIKAEELLCHIVLDGLVYDEKEN
jgi:uridine phosphorylase